MFLSQLSYYLRVTALAMLFALSARPETTALPKAANVTDCQPCKFQPSARLPPYSFRFEIKSDPAAGRTITAIEVTRQGDTKPLQRLPVAGAMPVFEGRKLFLWRTGYQFRRQRRFDADHRARRCECHGALLAF